MSMTVLSLCDYSGVMVRPWLDAGHYAWIVDTQHPRSVTTDGRLRRVGADIHELHPGHRWLPSTPDIVFAFPPCTHLAYSGQRWRRENGPTATAHGFLLFGKVWDLCQQFQWSASWMIENPDGVVCSWCKPDHSFHPYEYGDPWTKKTNLWVGGGFVMPKKKPVPVGDNGDRIHRCPPGPDR